MKISDEIRLEIGELKNQIETLQKEEKYKDALQLAEKLNTKYDQLKIEVAKEKASFENFMQHKEQVTNTTEDAAKLRNRAFNKLVLNPLRVFPEPITDEEKAAYFNVTGSPGQPGQIESIPAKGGYLVPSDQMSTLQEFRKEFTALKDYVNVINTNYTSGRWATYTQQDLEFQDFAEMTDIPESDVTFGEATYTITDKGLILPISNQLISDADVDIVSFMGRQLAEGAVLTENKAILKKLESLMSDAAATITSYKSLNTAMFKTLDGVYYNSTKIFTNQDGFLWLANIEDSTNRPLFVPDVTEPNKYLYRGKEIVVLPNSTLPNMEVSGKNYSPFLVGDLRSYITFFERQGMELAASDQVYWRKHALALKAIIRFDVVITDSNAMTALKVEV